MKRTRRRPYDGTENTFCVLCHIELSVCTVWIRWSHRITGPVIRLCRSSCFRPATWPARFPR